MASHAPTKPLDIPPYQLQGLLSDISNTPDVQVLCAQALGSEIYVGCSNGDLLRFALQADDPTKLESYTLLSRQSLPTHKSVDEIVLIPSLHRALILSDQQLHFYIIPSLDEVPYAVIKPLRQVICFAVDNEHLSRPPPQTGDLGEHVEFCVVKRASIAMYGLRDKLNYYKQIPFPEGTSLARRSGHILCIADRENYNIVDLEANSLIPMLPLSQAPETPIAIKPFITVVAPNEFLILSWTGASTLGLFITGDGDPVRGTLEWSSHPMSVCFDNPYIITLLPNETVEIHSIETQAITQVVEAPVRPVLSPSASRTRVASPRHGSSRSPGVSSTPPRVTSPSRHMPSSPPAAAASQVPSMPGSDVDVRISLISSLGGYLVPSTQRSEKMKLVKVNLLRNKSAMQLGAEDMARTGKGNEEIEGYVL